MVTASAIKSLYKALEKPSSTLIHSIANKLTDDLYKALDQGFFFSEIRIPGPSGNIQHNISEKVQEFLRTQGYDTFEVYHPLSFREHSTTLEDRVCPITVLRLWPPNYI